MPFTAAISISQGSDCTKFKVTDTSDYSEELKTSFTNRTIAIYRSDGTLFNALNFPFSVYLDDEIEVGGLDKDYAFKVIMVVFPITPQPGSVYVVEYEFALTCFTFTAFYERNQKQSIDPRYESNRAYVEDTHRLIMEIKAAEKAGAAGDITKAQLSLERARKIIDSNPIPY